MGPLPDDPQPAFVVTKIAQGNDLYVISINGGCDNMFGCIPSIADSSASFAAFVNQSSNAAKPTVGIRFVAASTNEEGAHGLAIVDVISGLPGEKAGLKVGDIVLKVDGVEVDTLADAAARSATFTPGHRAVFSINRGGKPLTVVVKT